MKNHASNLQKIGQETKPLRYLLFFSTIIVFWGSFALNAQEFVPNYDESKVPDYELPDPLTFENGNPVQTPDEWEKRREELLEIFSEHVYGKSPEWDGSISTSLIGENKSALNGIANLREYKVTLQRKEKSLDIFVLTFQPINKTPKALFMGYNFYGNHTITNDPAVKLNPNWIRNNESFHIVNNAATEESRGVRTYRWPLEEIVNSGYAVATIYYGDVDPDMDDGFKNGVHDLMDSEVTPSSWGSIAAWAWGMSRIADAIEQEQMPFTNIPLIAIGHSRLGKASLWAGATDNRFQIVISNNSGCGGAALSKRAFGETVGRINSAFPHWFADQFNEYNTNEKALPVDQHQLLALIAPRPLYVASATDDEWADPYGEFLASKHASEVYNFLGKEGLPSDSMPATNKVVMGTIGYHIREGKHDITLFDWQQYMDFADKHLN